MFVGNLLVSQSLLRVRDRSYLRKNSIYWMDYQFIFDKGDIFNIYLFGYNNEITEIYIVHHINNKIRKTYTNKEYCLSLFIYQIHYLHYILQKR